MHAYHFPPYMRTNFQRSILINKKVGPSAPRKGCFAVLRGVNPHKYTLLYFFCMNSMHTKFQLSILMNKKLLKWGALRPPTKGRFADDRRINLYVCISFYSMYADQISDFHLNNQIRGAFGPMPEPFSGPGGVSSYICISLYSILYEHYAY